MWKLMTGVITESTYTFLDENKILPEEQKRCRRESRETKEQLLIDLMVLQHCKKRLTNLAMAWVDYRKAYDMMPHSRIIECLEFLQIADNIKQFLTRSMTKWQTELTSSSESLGKVNIRRDIFQGGSLSPLLFVICMVPLTLVLRKLKEGYTMGQTRINHMFFMDDLKLFGKSERQIESLVNTVHAVSDDIGMEFGIKKCSVLIMKIGKVMTCEDTELPNGMTMKEVESEGYRYLGISELDKIKDKEMKEQFQKEYMRRLKAMFKSKLHRRNKTLAVNTWVVSVLRYGAGILKSNKDEIAKLDRRTRNMMAMYGALHPKSDVNRIYYLEQEEDVE